jgi:DNA ligase-associated metallophosphoesterase
VALVGVNAEMRLAGHLLTALPEGALWVHGVDALIVSDVHLEKGSAFAARGRMLPPFDTRAALLRLAGLVASLQPRIVVSLGDSFHDVGGPARMNDEDRGMLNALTAQCDWVWILGNHDPEVPAELGGRMLDELRIGELSLRHEPRAGSDEGEIAGHLHPCAKVSGRGTSVRRRCFAYDGARLVMPAFGAYAGGLNVRDRAFAPLFPAQLTALVLSHKRVLPAPSERLLADN